MGYSPRGRKESGTTEGLSAHALFTQVLPPQLSGACDICFLEREGEGGPSSCF